MKGSAIEEKASKEKGKDRPLTDQDGDATLGMILNLYPEVRLQSWISRFIY